MRKMGSRIALALPLGLLTLALSAAAAFAAPVEVTDRTTGQLCPPVTVEGTTASGGCLVEMVSEGDHTLISALFNWQYVQEVDCTGGFELRVGGNGEAAMTDFMHEGGSTGCQYPWVMQCNGPDAAHDTLFEGDLVYLGGYRLILDDFCMIYGNWGAADAPGIWFGEVNQSSQFDLRANRAILDQMSQPYDGQMILDGLYTSNDFLDVKIAK